MMICLYPFEQSSLRSDDISILHKVRLYIIKLMMYRIFLSLYGVVRYAIGMILQPTFLKTFSHALFLLIAVRNVRGIVYVLPRLFDFSPVVSIISEFLYL